MMNNQEIGNQSKTLQVQRRAQRMMGRDTRILIFVFLGSYIPVFTLTKSFTLIDLLFLPLAFLLYLANNLRRWNALVVNQVRCPHCGGMLAERVHLLSGPSPNCPRCKEVAFASIVKIRPGEIIIGIFYGLIIWAILMSIIALLIYAFYTFSFPRIFWMT
jgi:phage FluMu protein Com